jgi:hypothetical protein
MATTTLAQPSVSTRAVPWYIWCSAAAVLCAMVGVHWDISWHRSIGRDTFWTPAHICIHLCGVLAGISCAYLILSTTLNRTGPLRAASVKIWGFRGPLGAFIAAWGGIAMLTSAPFDDWWHNAYGLDVKILSPPHVVLALGIFGVELGALILILGNMNRADDRERGRLEWLFLYVGGMLIVCFLTLEMELTSRGQMHYAHFYRVVSMAVPVVLAGVAKASGKRWGATIVAGVYTVFLMAMNWILPLFPAEPKLGPVFNPLKQFTPPEFPLLLIVPAFALDLLWARTPHWKRWLQAVVSGVVFVGAFLAVQWPFANFLMSPAARNWFFATRYFGYDVNPASYYARYLFYPAEPAAVFRQELLLALAAAIVTTWLGLAWGAWMQRIRR